MTTFWSDWELQEEGKYDYRPVPKKTKEVTDGKDGKPLLLVGAHGRAEIKPHHLDGIAGGLAQLDKHPSTVPRILITYLPLKIPATPGTRGVPAETGRPAAVQVFATEFVLPTKTHRPLKESEWHYEARVALERRTWWDLGSFKPPARVALTLENRGLFGTAIERHVRNCFNEKVLVPSGRRIQPGSRQGPDVVWKELADLYSELGRELRDPLYAELALELSGQRA